MQLHQRLDTDLFHQLSEQEQEAIAGGADASTGSQIESIYKNSTSNQDFLNGLFGVLYQSGSLYNNFDYSGFFSNLQQSGALDSSSPGGSNSTVPTSFPYSGSFGSY